MLLKREILVEGNAQVADRWRKMNRGSIQIDRERERQAFLVVFRSEVWSWHKRVEIVWARANLHFKKKSRRGMNHRTFSKNPYSWSEGYEFESQQQRRKNFLLQSKLCVLTLMSVSVPPWHVRYPSHSDKSADGSIHLNTHTSLTQRSPSGLAMPLSRHSVEIYSETNSRNLSGNIGPQSSQLAEPLWTDHGIKEWNWCARANLH